MTRYRIQELLENLNDIISDEDLIFFPELKTALGKIGQTHTKNLKKYNRFLGMEYSVPYKDPMGREHIGSGHISEISNFYGDEVIVKFEFDDGGPGNFEFWKLSDLEAGDGNQFGKK